LPKKICFNISKNTLTFLLHRSTNQPQLKWDWVLLRGKNDQVIFR
jgi:hypothetical protein